MERAPTSAHLGYTRILLSWERVQDHHRGGSIELSLINGWLGVFRVRGWHSKGLNIMWEDVELRKLLALMVCNPQRVNGALPGAVVQHSCTVTAQL